MKQILVHPQDFKKSGIKVIKTQSTGMERNAVATIDELTIGDRFCRVGDKKKEVWQRVMHIVPSTPLAKRDKDKYPTPFKTNTPVIFLRHAE